MQFFRPSWSTILPPLVLILLAAAPSEAVHQLIFGVLAVPLMPVIRRAGFVYRDVGFINPAGAILTAVVWAIVLYVLLCLLRRARARQT